MLSEHTLTDYGNNSTLAGSPLLKVYLLNCHLQGYCIDLAEKVREVSITKYDYIIDLVGDKQYGKADLDKGCWNGMIGELTSDYDCSSGEPSKVSMILSEVICKELFFR